MPRIMPSSQAAEHFGVNIKTIRRWIKSGKLKGEQIDGRWHVHLEDKDAPQMSLNAPQMSSDALQCANIDIQHLREELRRADSETQHLREQLRGQLARRDDQIDALTRSLDQAQQLLAVQTKTNASLTDRLQALEDMRHRPWWRRILSR